MAGRDPLAAGAVYRDMVMGFAVPEGCTTAVREPCVLARCLHALSMRMAVAGRCAPRVTLKCLAAQYLRKPPRLVCS